MSCISPLPAPVALSICGSCNTCCSMQAAKRVPERISITMPWYHRLPNDGLVWTIKKVSHTVKQADGTSLAAAQYDPSLAYAAGVTVSFGPRLYTSNAPVPVLSAPVTIAGGNALWTDAGVNPHLYIALDGDFALDQWVDDRRVSSSAILAGGADDTDYRVESLVTFRDCNSRVIEFWDCTYVTVKDCT